MPDPIRCSADAAHPQSISCETVVIGPETSSAPTSAAPPPATPPPAPAVASLVKRFSPLRVVVHTEPVKRLTFETAERCAGRLLELVPLLLKLKSDPAAVSLGLVKADYDLQQCLSDDIEARQKFANRNAGIRECEAHGGTALGEVGNELTCAAAPEPQVKP